METLIFKVAYMFFVFFLFFFLFCFFFFFIYFAPRSNLTSVKISPLQDVQVGAKSVAYLIQTSLVTPYYKYFVHK